MLSDKALVNIFSDVESNEMTRKYTYQCYLMPDKCQQTYTSFANEASARMQMKSHLLGHIGEMLQEASSEYFISRHE